MKKSFDLGRDSISKIFVGYAIPAVMGMIVMSVAGIIDGLFVGRYVGPIGLAAVNLSFPLLHVLVAVAVMVIIGGSTYAAIEVGAERLKNANNGFTITILLVTSMSLAATIFGYLILPHLVSTLGADEITAPYLTDYLSTLFPFMVVFILTYGLDAFVRRDGRPGFSLFCMACGAGTNIVLDYLLVGVYGFGMKGAALATGFAESVSLIMFLSHFFSGRSLFRLIKPIFDWQMIRSMFFNGASELMNTISFGLVGLLFNRIIMARIGADGVAAYAVVLYMGSIGMWIFYGLGDAIGPGINFNVGAGNFDRIKKFLRFGLLSSLVVGVIWFVIVYFFHAPIAGLFTKNEANVINLASEIAKFYSPAFLTMGFNIVFSSYFTARYWAKQSLLVAMSRSLVLVSFALAVFPLIWGNLGIWISVPFAEYLTLFIALVLYKKTKHLKAPNN
jgi:putative MATE family efflux protein